MDNYPAKVVIPLSILSGCVVVTNTLVCLLVYRVKSMWSYTNGFVVSLATSDILTGLAFLVQYNIELHDWSRGALNVMYAIVLIGGSFNLCAVTYDRYLAILRPFTYLEMISRVFKILVPTIWVLSLLIACVPLTWNGNKKLLNTQIYICLVLVVCIVIPYILIVYANARIFRLVRRCVRRERELSISSQNTKVETKLKGERKVSSEAKVARVFAIASLMFVLSYFPSLFYTAASAFGHFKIVPNILLEISPFCVVAGSLVNPVLYSFMKPDFRRALQRILNTNTERSVRSTCESRSSPFLSNKSKKQQHVSCEEGEDIFHDDPCESRV